MNNETKPKKLLLRLTNIVDAVMNVKHAWEMMWCDHDDSYFPSCKSAVAWVNIYFFTAHDGDDDDDLKTL